jgi:septum site-determining protein MinD
MAKTIVIFSTKGGVGKTLIASNLSVSLARDQGQRVCLVDLDLEAVGDMARILGLSPQKSIADLIPVLKKQQNFKKKDFLLNTSLGIDFLPAVLKPQQSPHIEADRIKEIFSQIDNDYDYIIVDGGRSFNDIFVATLNESNLILLVVTPDILSIYQTKWVFDILQFLNFPLSMARLVLNRSESASSISWQEIRYSLPADIIAKIPSEGRAVGKAINQGIPVVIDNPKTKFALNINKLAEALVATKDLFLDRHELDKSRLKEVVLEKGQDFWKKEGLTEKLSEYTPEEMDEITRLKQRIHNRLIRELNMKQMELEVFKDAEKIKELRDRAKGLVNNLLVEEAGTFISSPEIRQRIVKEILDEALGLGILEDLLADPTITDIMVNNKDEVYIERNGKIELTNKKFISDEQIRTIIDRIIAPLGRHIDESAPMVDARLPDGSRINAIIPPLSLTGVSLTIRKFKKERMGIPELIGFGSLNAAMAELIKACVLSRKNIIVSGGTGSGKTTVLNILSEFIPENERIVTIEDAAELKLHQEHWIRLESRPPNIEGKGGVTIRDLFRNTLRMRPDRIIIGECRGVETLDMLQAMNTGHDGSMTTIHANSTQDVLVRMDSMILMSGVELPVKAIREMISSAIDVIVHTARLSDGSRKVVQISEILGMKDDIHVDLRDIFIFKQTGVDDKGKVAGKFQATGYIPSFLEELKVKGIPIPENIFKAG